MIELNQLLLVFDALIAALSNVKIYDRDLNLDKNLKGQWEELSHLTLVMKALQEELCVYNRALCL